MAVQTRNLTRNVGVFDVGVLGNIEFHTCGNCGVTWGMSETYLDLRRVDGKDWCCPNGHEWHWTPGKTEAQKLREQLADERSRSGRIAADRDQLKASLRTQKGLTTRARNDKARLIARVANGVCPCCNRTFKQLAAHISSQHPQYLETADTLIELPS